MFVMETSIQNNSSNPFFLEEPNNICAICTKTLHNEKNTLHSPINTKSQTKAYQVLESISQFKIDSKGPNFVCSICLKNIASTFKFQQICNKAQLLYDNYTRQIQEQSSKIVPTEGEKEEEELQHEHIGTKEQKEPQNIPPKKKVGRYKCNYCDSTFEYQSSYKSHLNRHEQKYVCSYCGRALGSKHCLLIHERIHTGERPFQCKECSMSFRKKEGLDHHTVVHTKETPFQCQICEKKFNRKTILRTHLRTHTGDRPHQCPECQKGFSQLWNMRKHLEMHGKDQKKKKKDPKIDSSEASD